jgi:hypothetical protein
MSSTPSSESSYGVGLDKCSVMVGIGSRWSLQLTEGKTHEVKSRNWEIRPTGL